MIGKSEEDANPPNESLEWDLSFGLGTVDIKHQEHTKKCKKICDENSLEIPFCLVE